MTEQQFDVLFSQAQKLMGATKDQTHDWSHCERVLGNALKIRNLLTDDQKNVVDENFLKLACVWHDISYAFFKSGLAQYVLEGIRGKKITSKYFTQAGVGQLEIDLMADVVLHHPGADFGFNNRKRSLYHQIVQDADWLDEFSPARSEKMKTLAKKSSYYGFINNILRPIFARSFKRNKDKFLNLKVSSEIVI